ncbi:MAG: ribonuclease D [Eggerthellaceae bacterium]|nr:ribonuclease D [Eggerthellaceae bacterium]
MRYIDDEKGLARFIEEAKRSELLAIDTEFLREKTYYPKACLIQVSTDDRIYIIDPIALPDVSAIGVLLEDEGIVKVFHAGTQDIEILLRLTGTTPWPIFDTQMAAALLGFSHQVGLGQLVSTICGVSLKKADSFTDWSRRPLSESQLDYAAGDVAFLPELYICMRDMLIQKGRMDWLDPDLEELADADHYTVDPNERFRHLKRGNQLTRKQLSAAREVAAWRERRAQSLDIPRKWVLSDEQIVEACRKEAKSIDDLYMIRGMRERLPVKDAREVISLMEKGFRLPEDEWPALDRASSSEPNVDFALDLMTAVSRLAAKENGIALQTLAPSSELTKLARGHVDECILMKGWRKRILGDELTRLLAGDLMLSLDGVELQMSNKRSSHAKATRTNV